MHSSCAVFTQNRRHSKSGKIDSFLCCFHSKPMSLKIRQNRQFKNPPKSIVSFAIFTQNRCHSKSSKIDSLLCTLPGAGRPAGRVCMYSKIEVFLDVSSGSFPIFLAHISSFKISKVTHTNFQ